jgi:hypothetical protein
MARKATVDREVVLQMLKEGKTSQAIANRFAVSRQAIDLYRKQFTTEGVLTVTPRPRPVSARPATRSPAEIQPPVSEPIAPNTIPAAVNPPMPEQKTPPISLDRLEDAIIEAFTALRRTHELESEIETLKQNYAAALQQIEQLKEREQKRREQEQRWLHAQQPGVMTYQNPTNI